MGKVYAPPSKLFLQFSLGFELEDGTKFKALNEVFKDNEFEYKAFNIGDQFIPYEGKQVIIQIKVIRQISISSS